MSNEPNIAVLPPDGYSYDATVSLDLSNYDEEHPGVVEGNYAVYRITLERKYRIKDADDWNTFCSRLSDNDTYNRFSGETVYLENDITVSSSAGYSQHDFCGIFDGQGHTLTFNYNGSGSDKYVAPFSFVSVAKPAGSSEDDPDVPVTIKNLNVKSTIRNSSVEGDGTHGGFIGVQSKNGGNITLEGCAFIGSLLGADTNNCGGFVGWRTKKITISDSIFAPESVTVSGTGSAVFARSSASVNNSYYFYEFGEDSDNQEKQGYSVTAGENVTLALSGEETQYKVF